MGLFQKIGKARATIAVTIGFITAVVLPLWRLLTRKAKKGGVKIVEVEGVEVKKSKT